MKLLKIVFLLRLAGFVKLQSNSLWTFQLYTSETTSTGTSDLNQANPSLPSVLIIHGWLQSSRQPWILQLKDEYLLLTPHNVITFDWSSDSNDPLYFPSADKVPEVGAYVGEYLDQLNINGIVDISKTKVIGFSLGAHVAGFAGQEYQTLSGGLKLPQIVGLDAAESNFKIKPPSERLDATDADIVQAFHTSTYGIDYRYGTIDVYFNYLIFDGCSKAQPGCPSSPGVPDPSSSFVPYFFCNHIRSAAYMIESVRSSNFLAVPCTCDTFGRNSCPTGTPIVVGEGLTPGAAGEYYLATACKPPFALGTLGLQGSASKYVC